MIDQSQPRMSAAEISKEIMSVHGKMLALPWTACPYSNGREQLLQLISETSDLIYADKIKALLIGTTIVHNRYIYSCAFPAVKILRFCLSRFQPSEAFARQVFDFYFELMMGWSEEREESLKKFGLEPDDLVPACRFMIAKQRNMLLEYARFGKETKTRKEAFDVLSRIPEMVLYRPSEIRSVPENEPDETARADMMDMLDDAFMRFDLHTEIKRA